MSDAEAGATRGSSTEAGATQGSSTEAGPTEGDAETYCRLCAEPTPSELLIGADTVVAANSKMKMKMGWINIDMSSTNHLPKAICFACFDSLEKTWTFLRNVKEAQMKLYGIYGKKLVVGAGCDIKAVSKLAEAGRPTVEKVIDAVKLEVTINTSHSIDATLLNIKKESSPEDEYATTAADNGDSDGSDSDLPLKPSAKKKKKGSKKRKIKKREKLKVKGREVKLEEVMDLPDPADLIPNPNAVAIPLDMSYCNMTWDDYPWRCAKCDTPCANLAALRTHSLDAHKCCCVFKCSDCEKMIANHKSFVNHVRIHNKQLRYCCDLCNKIFSLAQYVKKHRITEHSDIQLTMCQNCGANFATQDELQDHILNYAKGFRKKPNRKIEKIETELKCEFCDKEFKSKSNLQAHKQVHLERTRNFSCHVCGKMFFTKGTLGTHMMTHEEVKPFKCDFCPMAFRARGNLLSHISLHSGAKPFVCEQCGKCFRVKRHLKSHLIVHTDLMPFSCNYCGKPFRFKTRLNLHLRQHTGAKPYKCVHCQRDFTNGSNYKKHMMRRHNFDTGRKKYHEVPLEEATVQLLPFQSLS